MDYGNLDRAIAALAQADGLIGQILDKVVVDILDVSSADSTVLKTKILEIRKIIEEVKSNLETSETRIKEIENVVKGG